MTEQKLKIAVAGVCGRMGSTIVSLLKNCSDMKLVWAFESKNHPSIGTEIISGVNISDDFQNCQDADVLIDFTVPEATVANVKIAQQKNVKVVIGTTGFSQEQLDIVRAASEKIAIVISPNMSIGMNIMMKLVQMAAEMLGGNYEVEIIETHHHNKKDAPSGTALKLGEIINRTRGMDARSNFVYGRSGMVGSRKPEEIGIHAVRISEIVGEHTVMFGGKGEILEITHRCFSRESFASGALIAAKFIAGKEKGLYEMKDVIDWLGHIT
ncbi:MAG TPA: 4-hydroxy-tetrahydrodipicolinate reductase [bacterium]|nr:4-hydroxy-tetrahydrodipicolinate reductase [bacterium]HOL34973.1 4-hydroxy-tetrahydrodipicolinate reductase [bacterium]HPP07723.1 4-hydroxy-tetrahydrodipicolinate reductase [bacterium]